MRVRFSYDAPYNNGDIMSEEKIIVEFNKEDRELLNRLTKALEENNKLLADGNPNEFAREVCANIYADILLNSIINTNQPFL